MNWQIKSLCVATLGVATLLAMPVSFTSVARAQTTTDSTYFTGPNRFDQLQAAADSYIRGDGDYNDIDEHLPLGESLRRARAAVGRNGKTLQMVREALKGPIEHPAVTKDVDSMGDYKQFWLLAHLLKQDSDVRGAGNDWNGALNSDLDIIELGVALAHGGPLAAGLAGRDIETLGHLNLENYPPKISSDENQAAADRVAKIESRRAPFFDSLRSEKATALALTKESIDGGDWDTVVSDATDDDGNGLSDYEKTQVLNMGEDDILANMSAVLDSLLEQTKVAYAAPKPKVASARDPWTRLVTRKGVNPELRIGYESARTQNLLLGYALVLHATKMKTGSYPDNLPVVADPFSDGSPLKYKSDGKTYTLYSLGPNAKDDGGIPPTKDAGGDVLAPTF